MLRWLASGVALALLRARASTFDVVGSCRDGGARERHRKFQAPHVANKLNGIERSWRLRGTLRAEFRHQHGALTEARAWDGDGMPR